MHFLLSDHKHDWPLDLLFREGESFSHWECALYLKFGFHFDVSSSSSRSVILIFSRSSLVRRIYILVISSHHHWFFLDLQTSDNDRFWFRCCILALFLDELISSDEQDSMFSHICRIGVCNSYCLLFIQQFPDALGLHHGIHFEIFKFKVFLIKNLLYCDHISSCSLVI